MRTKIFVLILVLILTTAVFSAGAESASKLNKLGPYTGITVEKIDLTVSEADVSKEVDSMLQMYAETDSNGNTTVPQLTDEFAKEHLNCESKDAYLVKLRNILKEEKAEDAEAEYQQTIMDAIIDASDLTYDETEEQTRVDGYMNQFKQICSYYGIDMDTLAQQYYGIEASELEELLYEQAKFTIAQDLILDAVAEAEALKLDDETFKTKKQEFEEKYGLTDDTISASYSDEELTEMFMDDITWDKLFELNGCSIK